MRVCTWAVAPTLPNPHQFYFVWMGGASGGHLAIILDEGKERLVIEVQNHTLTYDVSYPFYEDIIKKTWHGN